MTVQLPEELAPALRARAEALLAECQQVHAPDVTPKGTREERNGRGACYVCRSLKGRMGGHHLVPGDDSTVVPVHPACHRRLHNKGKTKAPAGTTA